MKQAHLQYLEETRNERQYIAKVYGWMSASLLVTSLAAYLSALSPAMTELLTSNPFLLVALMILELIFVLVIGSMVYRLPVGLAAVMLMIYSVLNGVTISAIFQVFTTESIASTFLITASTFALMCLYGLITKTDLTKVGNILLMTLIGLILAGSINILFNNAGFYWGTTILGVIVFAGLTAFDTQKIKDSCRSAREGGDQHAIVGALMLYLDFINLFLSFIRMFGKRRSSW